MDLTKVEPTSKHINKKSNLLGLKKINQSEKTRQTLLTLIGKPKEPSRMVTDLNMLTIDDDGKVFSVNGFQTLKNEL